MANIILCWIRKIARDSEIIQSKIAKFLFRSKGLFVVNYYFFGKKMKISVTQENFQTDAR